MNVLFVCTGNACRSILSEALFNHASPAHWHAYSAGSRPAGSVHPATLNALSALHIASKGLYSKAIADISADIDVVITVCGHADQACPIINTGALRAHWGLADPTAVPAEVTFEQTIVLIQKRLQAWFAVDFESLNTAEQQACLTRIGALQ